MKRLFIVRHGKSSWEHNVQDHQRPLKKRASKDAWLVISALKNSFGKPDKIWSSYATRALESAKIFKEKLEVETEDFLIRKDLYTFNAGELHDIINSCDNPVNELMIFGHNPAVTEVVNSLGDIYFENIPTTGLTVIEFDAKDWKQLGSGKTILYLFPKNLK